ncbi:intradiol ring-cleavage dioxygenase [Epilithonimonas sp. UC225_85]|uniref:dioxygenase family protein n=1 Tax=Epilithonimonas sp. UC225_85 TaxID=3350167 RepID=UPI0036D3958C
MRMVSRKDFLKSLGLAGVTVLAAPLILHCRSNDDESEDVTIDNSVSTACAVTNSETEGPFPTKSPSDLVQTNIVGDRTGVPFEINLTIQNVKADCAALQNVIVDIWHCDKDGNYSEYGGTGMQSTNYTSYHFLRGRQTTNASGQVSFTSVFPGWYDGRATHIHVHIYNNVGTSLLITQIAFPEGSGSAVEMVNASTGYRGMSGYTYNANDNVFSDGTANEMSIVSGSVSEGFKLTHTIKVNA